VYQSSIDYIANPQSLEFFREYDFLDLRFVMKGNYKVSNRDLGRLSGKGISNKKARAIERARRYGHILGQWSYVAGRGGHIARCVAANCSAEVFVSEYKNVMLCGTAITPSKRLKCPLEKK
jgi:hypothetical protein